VRFTLELQVAASDDVVDDPTIEWPRDRERVAAGVEYGSGRYAVA